MYTVWRESKQLDVYALKYLIAVLLFVVSALFTCMILRIFWKIFFICFVYMFWLLILFFKIPVYIVFHGLGGKQGGGIKYCFYSINQNVWTQRLLKNTCKQYFKAAKQWNTCRSIVVWFDEVTLVLKHKLNNLI